MQSKDGTWLHFGHSTGLFTPEFELHRFQWHLLPGLWLWLGGLILTLFLFYKWQVSEGIQLFLTAEWSTGFLLHYVSWPTCSTLQVDPQQPASCLWAFCHWTNKTAFHTPRLSSPYFTRVLGIKHHLSYPRAWRNDRRYHDSCCPWTYNLVRHFQVMQFSDVWVYCSCWKYHSVGEKHPVLGALQHRTKRQIKDEVNE